jgi:hypothetical protein
MAKALAAASWSYHAQLARKSTPDKMDHFSRQYLRMIFKERFTDAQGNDFQKLFGQIMNLRFPHDFTQTRPWGKLGDDKCDGYLPSQRRFYQCYAPDDMKKSETLKKLRADFAGALPHKRKHFTVWVFVHNARDGQIPSWLTLELDRLRQEHQDITVETLGYFELLEEALKLGEGQLVDLFGPLPSQRDMLAVKFKDVLPLLEHLSRQTLPTDMVPSPVSPKKLKYNRLSAEASFCLQQGMIKAKTVRDYLDRTPDKELAARVAGTFRAEYERLRKEQSDPDAILRGLRVFTQGPFVLDPQIEAAVMAVLAYLFEECDIFESPPEG